MVITTGRGCAGTPCLKEPGVLKLPLLELPSPGSNQSMRCESLRLHLLDPPRHAGLQDVKRYRPRQ